MSTPEGPGSSSSGAGPHKLSKRARIGVVAAGVGLAGYLWWQRRQASAAAAAAAPAVAGDAASATDTATLGMDAGAGPGVYGATGTAASSSTVGTVSTNADWYNAALSAVLDAGYDNATAAAALSAYLDHQPLTAAQQGIVRIGLAAAGTPPTGTFTIISAPPPAPTAVGQVRHVYVITLNKVDFTIGWNAVTGATGYYVYTNGHRTELLHGTFEIINTARTGTPITAGGRYTVTVTAVDASGKEGPASAPITVTTKK